jgi:SAM-dependent methyltransferase
MLAAARSLAVAAGLQVAWRECSAEDTGLPSASFDVVTAAQCWHWFDGEAAAGEVRRLLVSGGLVAVCGFDWLPLPDTVSGVTEALIQAYNPSWNLGGIRDPGPEARRHLSGAGFVVVETFTFDVDVPYSVDSWRLRIRASAAILDLDTAGAAAFDAELAGVMADRFPVDSLMAPHRVWASVAVAPS